MGLYGWVMAKKSWFANRSFFVSANLLNKVKNININKKPRSKLKPSDHTPIELEIN